jgi:hypothetical protein
MAASRAGGDRLLRTVGTSEFGDRRPIGLYRQRRRRESRERVLSEHDLAVHDGQHRFDRLDFFVIYAKLQVGDRSAAVKRARELRLLAPVRAPNPAIT